MRVRVSVRVTMRIRVGLRVKSHWVRVGVG